MWSQGCFKLSNASCPMIFLRCLQACCCQIKEESHSTSFPDEHASIRQLIDWAHSFMTPQGLTGALRYHHWMQVLVRHRTMWAYVLHECWVCPRYERQLQVACCTGRWHAYGIVSWSVLWPWGIGTDQSPCEMVLGISLAHSYKNRYGICVEAGLAR